MKKWISLFIVVSIIFVLTGCGNDEKKASSDPNKKSLIVGFSPGPYIDEFKEGIEPQLKKKGYTIEYKNFSDGVQENLALDEGSVDANVFQHRTYLTSINNKEKINNVPIVQVPTPPMGIYSKKEKSLENIKNGASVAIPSDPSNMARALGILKEAGLIEIKENDPLSVSLNDVTSNPHKLNLIPLESANAARALDDSDYVAIQGNFAVSNGLKLKNALKLENMTEPFINIVAVTDKNKDAQWAKDIVSAYKNQSFQDVIEADSKYDNYRLPDYFKK
ncbi:MetQ/NlpA family ABC transporter substrate-binding protein [Niallia sp. 01092]|uniref:MetQ/NlpA family ABC transporter substrate-binding protein n=1 Tax=unclassified Niallia TaxID=2837522 RepID=UPI003FD2EF5C